MPTPSNNTRFVIKGREKRDSEIEYVSDQHNQLSDNAQDRSIDIRRGREGNVDDGGGVMENVYSAHSVTLAAAMASS